jgi:hypothetical protein
VAHAGIIRRSKPVGKTHLCWPPDMTIKRIEAEAFGGPTLGEFAWFFLRAPDGRVFAIEQVPD